MHYTETGRMAKFTTINSWDEFSPLKTVLLGNSRLRTETAGIVGAIKSIQKILEQYKA